MLRLHSEVAKNGVVETEAVFDLEDRLMAALDVEEHIVRLHELFDRIGERTTAPVFDAVNLAALFGDEGLVARDHRGNLFTLVRMHDDADFVVTHLASLRKKPPRASFQCGKDSKGRDCTDPTAALQVFKPNFFSMHPSVSS